MRKLQLDLGELEMAFGEASWESSYFLDLETGQVIWIRDETNWKLESLYEEADVPEDGDVDLAAVLQESDMDDWERQLLLEADQIERLYGTRYIRVPEADSHEDYRDMERFIATVEDEFLQDQLWQAIQGRGVFRRFKDVLASHYREQKQWYAFKYDLVTKRILDWLESQGIEAIFAEPLPAKELEPPGPTDRERLLAEVLVFVRASSQLVGVSRIALFDSLTTEEPDPKDADMLATVSDDMDLAPLATLGRKLQGHAQSFARGGKVFLADQEGAYLGRTCPWKRCGPGIRVSCDALHCGRRRYLHDDLDTICLDANLVNAPPIELWPEVRARVPVPVDVEQEVLRPLREKRC